LHNIIIFLDTQNNFAIIAHDEGQEFHSPIKIRVRTAIVFSLLLPSSAGAPITERGTYMKDILIWVLVIMVILLGALLVTAIHQNHNLQREIQGWSDQVMELERMIGE